MSEHFTEGHYLLGIEGLALLRAGAKRRSELAHEQVEEIRELMERLDEQPYAARREMPEHDVESGYAGWAANYDEPGNELIQLEQPLVRGLLAELPNGPVLDAACGTGRHTAYLVQLGYEVVGVDSSAAMLSRAREKLRGVELRVGDLTRLPLEDASVTGAVCALALSHLPELGPPIAELARVLAPGGRLVISNPHPLATGVFGWRAAFPGPDGERASIPEHPHRHGDYIEAFAGAGLVARRCLEPGLTAAEARSRAKAGHEEAFDRALTGLPAVIVWEAERA
jgi:SAM-dependent methyltransferase